MSHAPDAGAAGRVRAQELQADGYDVGRLPEEEGDLIKSVLNDETARFNSADLNVAYKMDVPEYQRLCPYAEALEENWGKAPGDCCTALQPKRNKFPANLHLHLRVILATSVFESDV